MIVLLLAACAHAPPPPRTPSGKEALSLSGRVSVQHDEHGFSGQFQWVSKEDGERILLSDPLGQGVARIFSDPLETRIELKDGRIETAPDAELLTKKLLGFVLPLGGMKYWLAARPSPSTPHEVTLSADGHVERIEQDGWTINYRDYDSGRPNKMRFTRPDLDIKLIVDHWGS
jgi:outer membrane lipoprotein LolB